MISTLEYLQNSVFEILRSSPQLERVGIFKKSVFFDGSYKFPATGMGVFVCLPRPLKASKYSVGPAFSKVIFCIEIVVEKHSFSQAYSPLFIAELATKKLHKAQLPLACGYGKAYLSDENPYGEYKISEQTFAIKLNFETQALLQ